MTNFDVHRGTSDRHSYSHVEVPAATLHKILKQIAITHARRHSIFPECADNFTRYDTEVSKLSGQVYHAVGLFFAFNISVVF